MGCSGTFFNVPIMAYTQETIAPEMMGKVFFPAHDGHDPLHADRASGGRPCQRGNRGQRVVFLVRGRFDCDRDFVPLAVKAI
jgi:hypothetical protein